MSTHIDSPYKSNKKQSYNDRLFSKGLRGYIHSARFIWIAKTLALLNHNATSVIELGCYDGKVLQWLPETPEKYLGLDADWEGGLDIAREHYKNNQNFQFIRCTEPKDLTEIRESNFNTFICMETFEHIDPAQVKEYLSKFADLVNGYVFVTVPNEKGILFLIKHCLKKLLGYSGKDKYSASDIFYSTIGRLDLVPRNQHKGFDYQALASEIGNYFDIISISGVQIPFLPSFLNVTVGIVAKSKKS